MTRRRSSTRARYLAHVVFLITGLVTSRSASSADSARAGNIEAIVAPLASVGRCMSPSFSPDGSTLAFVADMSGSPQVWVVDARGGWPHVITAHPERIRSAEWSPAGDWILVHARDDTYLVRPDGTDLRPLSPLLPDGIGGVLWSRDGELLLIYTSTLVAEELQSVYALDPDEGQVRVLSRDVPPGIVVDVSHDARRLLLFRMPGRENAEVHLFDLNPRRTQNLTPHEGPALFANPHFSPDDATIFFEDHRNEWRGLSRVVLGEDGTAGAIEVIAEREGAELQDGLVSPDGRRLALVWNADGTNELSFLDLESKRARPGPQLPGRMTWELTWSRDARFVALLVFGANRPIDVWRIEVSSGVMNQVTHASHPGVRLDALVVPELVQYSSDDGQIIKAWLYRAAGGSEPGPYVISLHGGPRGQERTALRGSYQGLLANGIGVLAPNFRGSTGFGKQFGASDNQELRFDVIADVRRGAEYLVASGLADPDLLGVTGLSYGGWLTWVTLTAHPELFRAAVVQYGVFNMETWMKNTTPELREMFVTEFGDPTTQAALLSRLSPIHRIDRVRAPVLLLHGAQDRIVPLSEATAAVDALSGSLTPLELIVFDDEGHGFRRTENRIAADVALVQFFARHLREARSKPKVDDTAGDRPAPESSTPKRR